MRRGRRNKTASQSAYPRPNTMHRPLHVFPCLCADCAEPACVTHSTSCWLVGGRVVVAPRSSLCFCLLRCSLLVSCAVLCCRTVSSLASKLQSGWTLLAETCPQCGTP